MAARPFRSAMHPNFQERGKNVFHRFGSFHAAVKFASEQNRERADESIGWTVVDTRFDERFNVKSDGSYQKVSS